MPHPCTSRHKPAGLKLNKVQKPDINAPISPSQQHALHLWTSQHLPSFEIGATSDQLLNSFNKLAIGTSIVSGAEWLPGKPTRGTFPVFRKVGVFKAMVTEAIFRQKRLATSVEDARTTARPTHKLQARLAKAPWGFRELRSLWTGLQHPRGQILLMAVNQRDEMRA